MKYVRLHILLTIFAALACISTSAATQVDGIYYEFQGNGTAVVTSLNANGHSYAGNINIPEYVTYGSRKYKVTAIGHKAFCNCPNLMAINIPESITEIGANAFYNCSTLATVDIPNSVTTIGNYAFANCRSLIAVSIHRSMKKIGTDAFSGCNSLTAVFIDDLYNWCNIEFASGKSNPLNHAANLYLNKQTVTNLTIPSDITNIRNYAFFGCRSIVSVDIHKQVTEIGTDAFGSCSLLNAVNIEDVEAWLKIQHGDLNIFSDGCDFYLNGAKLTDLVIPESITIVPRGCFRDCKTIESITLHKDVCVILQDAFNGCWNVRKIVCHNETPPVCGEGALENITRNKCTLFVPEKSELVYKGTKGWGEFTNISSY